MATVSEYRDILRRVMGEYVQWSSGTGIKSELIEDVGGNHFQVLRYGRERNTYLHGTIVHADIIGDKIWIQYDGTDRPLAEELAAAGIPKDQIVLGFKSPRVRALGEYAVG